MSSKLTRRAGDDLLTLGERFEVLYRSWLPLTAHRHQIGAQAHALAWQRSGVDTRPDHRSEGEIERFLDELGRTQKETGFAELDRQWEKFNHKIEPIARAIMRAEAHTVADIRVKTLVALYTNRHLWREPFDDLDWDQRGARSLIEACCALTAVPLPTEDRGDASVH